MVDFATFLRVFARWIFRLSSLGVSGGFAPVAEIETAGTPQRP